MKYDIHKKLKDDEGYKLAVERRSADLMKAVLLTHNIDVSRKEAGEQGLFAIDEYTHEYECSPEGLAKAAKLTSIIKTYFVFN